MPTPAPATYGLRCSSLGTPRIPIAHLQDVAPFQHFLYQCSTSGLLASCRAPLLDGPATVPVAVHVSPPHRARPVPGNTARAAGIAPLLSLARNSARAPSQTPGWFRACQNAACAPCQSCQPCWHGRSELCWSLAAPGSCPPMKLPYPARPVPGLHPHRIQLLFLPRWHHLQRPTCAGTAPAPLRPAGHSSTVWCSSMSVASPAGLVLLW